MQVICVLLGQIERCQVFSHSFISDIKLCFDLVVFLICYYSFEALCFFKCIQLFLQAYVLSETKKLVTLFIFKKFL